MKQYTTERGIKIGIMPIPLLLDKIREAHGGPAVPTYTEKTAGGDQEVELDADMMDAAKEHNPEWYEEHEEAWAAYLEERAVSDKALNDRIWNAVQLKSVRVDMPKDGSWAEEQAFLGLDVPEGAIERRIYYVETEIVGGPIDILNIMAMASGGEVSEEVLAQAEDSFRGLLQKEITEELTDQVGAMENEPETEPGASGGEVRESAV